ncbi:MAG: hypothetical protein ACQEQV_07155 [Fibrobacterota bacterium]
MAKDNLSPEEFENLFDELSALVNSRHTASSESSSEQSSDESETEELDESFLDDLIESSAGEDLREDSSSPGAAPVSEKSATPAQNDSDALFEGLMHPDGEHPVDHFECPVCSNTDYEAHYMRGEKNFRFIAYECTQCSILFREPQRFSQNREPLQTEDDQREDRRFTCPLCGAHSFTGNYSRDIGDITVESYQCAQCSVLFDDPDRFSVKEKK